jgi:hypothetical protein
MGNSWDNNGQKHGNNSTNGVFPYYPRCFMVLEYLPAKLGYFWGKCRLIFHTWSIWLLFMGTYIIIL